MCHNSELSMLLHMFSVFVITRVQYIICAITLNCLCGQMNSRAGHVCMHTCTQYFQRIDIRMHSHRTTFVSEHSFDPLCLFTIWRGLHAYLKHPFLCVLMYLAFSFQYLAISIQFLANDHAPQRLHTAAPPDPSPVPHKQTQLAGEQSRSTHNSWHYLCLTNGHN